MESHCWCEHGFKASGHIFVRFFTVALIQFLNSMYIFYSLFEHNFQILIIIKLIKNEVRQISLRNHISMQLIDQYLATSISSECQESYWRNFYLFIYCRTWPQVEYGWQSITFSAHVCGPNRFVFSTRTF